MARSVAATRIDASRRRLAELSKRMERLRAGEAPTRTDVEHSRQAAKAQQEATRDAHRRLLSTQASAMSQTIAIAELRAERIPSGQRSMVGLAEENQRLRDAVVTIESCSSRTGNTRSEHQLRWVWRALVDECRSADWRGWANALCVVTTRLMPAVRGASLTLYDTGHDAYPQAASDRWTWDVELIHEIVGEGPALEVSPEQRHVRVDDLDEAYPRWPGFVDLAIAAGVRSVSAFLVELGGLTGSFTLYRGAPTPLDDLAAVNGPLLAEVAASALAADADAMTDDDGRAYLGEYEDVSIAAGILSVQRRISLADARVQLQVEAYTSGRGLIETAQAVLKGTFPTGWLS